MKIKNITINSLIIFFSTILALAIVELFLRINGQGPWGNLDHTRNDPTINKPSSTLGWEPKPGKYEFEPFSKNGKKFKINILEDGSRKVSFYKNNSKINEQIIFIGGSVTLGWGVNDDQTFVSQIQKKIKNYKIKNFSSGGYGTYQSFLRLEKILKTDDKTKYVFLTYFPHHSIRNIGSEFWLRTLNKYSKRGYVSLPYASVSDDGNLTRKDPITYIRIPFMDNLSISNKIAKRIMRLKLKDNEENALKVTNVIFHDLKQMLDKKNIKLIVLDLAEKKGALDPFLGNFSENNIKVVNCNLKQGDNLIIKGDGHPNELMHLLYSECILNKFNF